MLWFLSAAAIRVGDALTVVGTTRAATEGGTEVEANAAAGGGYREGPAPRTFWRISSGPSRNNGPLVSSRSPEEIPAVVAEFLAVDGRPTWLR